MTLSEIAAALTGERMMTKWTGGGREHPSREEIARLAYHFYEVREEARWPGYRRLAIRRARTHEPLSVAVVNRQRQGGISL